MQPIILLDSGDTMFDEGLEQVGLNHIVTTAPLLADVAETLTQLHTAGYRLCLVADGRVASFENLLGQSGLRPLFEQLVISEAVGVEKPAQAMFAAAMQAMGATDKRQLTMVGNNLARDITGANRFGINSVWFDWSPRYAHTIASVEQQPTARITHFAELPHALKAIRS